MLPLYYSVLVAIETLTGLAKGECECEISVHFAQDISMWKNEAGADCKANKAVEEEFLNQIASYRRRYNTLYPRGPLLLLTPFNEEDRMVGSLYSHLTVHLCLTDMNKRIESSCIYGLSKTSIYRCNGN